MRGMLTELERRLASVGDWSGSGVQILGPGAMALLAFLLYRRTRAKGSLELSAGYGLLCLFLTSVRVMSLIVEKSYGLPMARTEYPVWWQPLSLINTCLFIIAKAVIVMGFFRLYRDISRRLKAEKSVGSAVESAART